jgi:hypothetical protein
MEVAMRYGIDSFARVLLATVCAGMLLMASDAVYADGPYKCHPQDVGYRTDVNRLKIECTEGSVFWAYEATANSTCGTKASYDAIKMFLSTATSSLLSGKSITIYFVTQTGCNTTDPVPREIYLEK